MKPEQKWQLSCSLTWAIAALCLLCVFASRWDCGRSLYMDRTGYWRKIKPCNSSVPEDKKKHTSWHGIKCILSSCSEGGGGGWVLIIQTMNTIKSRRNTGGIPFRLGLRRRGSAHTYARWKSCTCARIRHDDCEDHNYKRAWLSSLLRGFFYFC